MFTTPTAATLQECMCATPTQVVYSTNVMVEHLLLYEECYSMRNVTL